MKKKAKEANDLIEKMAVDTFQYSSKSMEGDWLRDVKVVGDLDIENLSNY